MYRERSFMEIAIEDYKNTIMNTFTLGRMSRRAYWNAVLIDLLLGTILGIVGMIPVVNMLVFMTVIVRAISMFTAQIRRLHDAGHTMVTAVIPVVMNVLLAILFIMTFIQAASLPVDNVALLVTFIACIVTTLAYIAIFIISIVLCCKPSQTFNNKYGLYIRDYGGQNGTSGYAI